MLVIIAGAIFISILSGLVVVAMTWVGWHCVQFIALEVFDKVLPDMSWGVIFAVVIVITILRVLFASGRKG